MVVEPHEAAVTQRPWHGRQATEFARIQERFETATTRDVPAEVVDYLASRPVAFECDVAKAEERAFVVMCALDQAAMIIHPAIKTRFSGRSLSAGPMLAAMRSDRTAKGSYGAVEKGLVLPKGHLMPGKPRTRGEDESGSALAHHFSFLSFVPTPAKHFILRPLALPPSRLSVSEAASSLVGLAPIAEDRDDLEFSASERQKRPYLDTAPAESNLKDRIEEQVCALLDKGAGLIVLPELVTSGAAAENLSESLRKQGRSHNAMVLVGSGPSVEISDEVGRPYNESLVMTAQGDELFRQRKLNAFNMAWKWMEECSVPRAVGHEAHAHMEDCATGQELVICDIHGLGRVMVLICEDLEQQTPGGDVCLHALPDWVLTPVLDVGLAFGRWHHRRAIEIGRKSLSRFVVSCSAILQVRALNKDKLIETAEEEIRTGFCFDGREDLRAWFVATGGPTAERHMVVEWKADTWKKHRIEEGH
ncbi:hypothetical protein [Sinorhizobium sp. Sb3]|uniref:hypothetical protein n=1 Tax=Sinorhizobium sp. Sb3 TaxID=1358417 RepID=UPI0012E3D6F2|nr:hypothetical protein [Sinorhizobium sp. Sb3]